MKLKLSPSALADFIEVAEYLLEHNPSTARMFADTLDSVFEHLKSHPEMGRPVNVRDMRVFTLTAFRHRIFYRVADDTLIVERIFHASRNPDTI